ncbi:MAG: hypothetical protein COV29_03160 [Candidatus Yanofskybacteria bacterium CG10_big_fil_rev_8_21_14_0_10_36_16]|uniref:Sodium/calcium exchanger membrane region domain-containing protein n=1 Tax=Candidatus Yanofskybacteria bacterium CG10_big_fil_rev_8_21_14_0_10_36_16 TaxID=1975096 RepID=A0A2J0Q6Y2_9BACT|nr:MAG: hypothetical protein COV29_03160 [Candidatus Yanofskybacteria bacterium CG10_big_fil_rev_8_21_14_0_10_36_16]
MIISQLAIFAIAFFILAWASKILISSLTRIAQFLRMSEYAASFILMGIATSVPELFLAVSSGAGGVGELSFGNVIGANILNVTLLIGLIAVIGKGIKARPSVQNSTSTVFLVSILPFVLIHDGLLDWIDGFLLIIVYIWYLSRLIKRKHELEQDNSFKLEGDVTHKSEEEEVKYRVTKGLPLYGPSRINVFKQVFSFLGALILLLGSSFLIINTAQGIAENLHIELVVFGMFIIAFGTTIPELVFGVRSVMLNHDEMTVGNALGSLVVNSTLVLGIAAVISPIQIIFSRSLVFSIIFLGVAIWTLKVFLRGDKIAITQKEGFALISIYVIFFILSRLL